MPTPFDATLAGVFWSGRSVGERSISQLVTNVKSSAPNMTEVYVKTSDGAFWQGHFDETNPGLTMSGPPALTQWIDTAGKLGLHIHAWCVLNGEDAGGEAQRVLEACAVPGLKSMLLDVEDGTAFFNGGAENARGLIESIRRGLPPIFTWASSTTRAASIPSISTSKSGCRTSKACTPCCITACSAPTRALPCKRAWTRLTRSASPSCPCCKPSTALRQTNFCRRAALPSASARRAFRTSAWGPSAPTSSPPCGRSSALRSSLTTAAR